MHARGDALSREARELCSDSGLPYSVAKRIVTRNADSWKPLLREMFDLDAPSALSWPAGNLWSRLGSEVWDEVAGAYVVHRAHDVAGNILGVHRHVVVGAVVIEAASQLGVDRALSRWLEEAWSAYCEVAATAAASAQRVSAMLGLVETRWRQDDYWERLADEEVRLVQLTESLMRSAIAVADAMISCIVHAPVGLDLTWVFDVRYCDWGESQIATAFHNAGVLTNHGLFCARFRRTQLLDLVATYGESGWVTRVPATNRDGLLGYLTRKRERS
jgi:hypothetical protein